MPYVEDPKNSEVVRYKINTEKSFVFQYTSNEQPKKEIEKATPFTIAYLL